MLENTQRTITEIADSLGYSSPSHFSNAFKAQEGVYPYEYRKTKL